MLRLNVYCSPLIPSPREVKGDLLIQVHGNRKKKHGISLKALNDDGRGYELARKLETLSVWRTWLGDYSYSIFVPFLSSTSTWESFMRADDSKSRAQIQLQLRVRALLFDKASVSLFLRSPPPPPPPSSSLSPSYSPVNSFSSSSLAISKLNPNYLQLHGDDVYFTLENSSKDGGLSNKALSKIQPKASSSVARGRESEIGDSSQRLKNELPDTWYNQFIEKYTIKRPYRLSYGNYTPDKRTAEDMSSYLRLLEKHKKRRAVFKNDQLTHFGNSVSVNAPNSVFDFSNSVEDDSIFFPEIMFTFNCVPESALPPPDEMKENNRKLEFCGVLDTLPQHVTRSPAMMDRLGVKPEYLRTDRGGNLYCGKNGSGGSKKILSQEQSLQMSQKVIARMLISVGFEGVSEVPLEVFSQFLSCHICKLGSTLRVLADSYRKQCSAVDLLRIFLKTMGYNNFGPLAELLKDGSRNFARQAQQQVLGVQPHMLPQHQNILQVSQQVPRQMHPQMQQMIHPQNLTLQQQLVLEKMRRQASNPRTGLEVNKDRPLVQVKVENTELPMDGNALNVLNARQQHLHFRQQQMAAISNLHASPGNQFRQVSSMQIPPSQTQNAGGVVRAPPVKVEGFQELMGGDSTPKHDSEESRLTSPLSK